MRLPGKGRRCEKNGLSRAASRSCAKIQRGIAWLCQKARNYTPETGGGIRLAAAATATTQTKAKSEAVASRVELGHIVRGKNYLGDEKLSEIVGKRRETLRAEAVFPHLKGPRRGTRLGAGGKRMKWVPTTSGVHLLRNTNDAYLANCWRTISPPDVATCQITFKKC